MICLINPVNFLLFLLLDCTEGKNIKINIDADDVLKLLNGFISSNTFKKIADQIIQRTAVKNGGYNNPYHPEDDIINNLESTMHNEKIKFKSKQNRKLNIDKENTITDDILEKENIKFMESKGEDKNEDILTDNEPADKHSIPNGKQNKPVLSSITLKYEKGDHSAHSYTTTTKQLQRRYILRNSK